MTLVKSYLFKQSIDHRLLILLLFGTLFVIADHILREPFTLTSFGNLQTRKITHRFKSFSQSRMTSVIFSRLYSLSLLDRAECFSILDEFTNLRDQAR